VTDKKLPPEFARLLSSFESTEGPSPEEGLRLIKAFMSIKDPALRTTILEIVDKIAGALTTKH
jgi:hypothetical protein